MVKPKYFYTVTETKTNDSLKPNMTTRFLNSIASALCLTGLTLSASAQKLPDVQESPFAAPANIKVDGKNKEWNNTFQALNKRTNIYYTIANDDDNLYFAFKSADATAGAKILAGGITVGVNPDGKKKEKERISMTYPIVPRPNFGGGGQGSGRRMAAGSVITVAAPSGGGGGGNMPSAKQMDSAMVAMQRKRLALVKEIRISGFKNTTDTLVSIYNEHGIKAFSSIGLDNTFFCEMAIPLAELGLTKDHAKEFVYNIKLNGLQIGGGLDGGSFSGVVMGGGGGRQHAGGMSGINFQDLLSPTDFWGKYTLVKK